jgi:excisionase family DNA binding protein
MDQGRYLGVEEAAKYMALSVSYIQKLTSRRLIPYTKVGRRALYDRVLLDKWMARRTVLPRDWA